MLYEGEKLISILERVHGKTTISFDTNFRKAVWDDPDILRDFLKRGAPLIDILFVSRSDDRNIFGERTPQEAMSFYKDLGYKHIIFRQGAGDVLMWVNDETMSVPAEKNVKVIDATAAGDAFNAGYLYGQLQGLPVRGSAELANKCAAYVLGTRGALAQNFHINEVM
jgi:2-dehydro-3-deoxygluconokinase